MCGPGCNYLSLGSVICVLILCHPACQTSISGGRLDCLHCNLAGPGRCDPTGCPPKTVYDKIEKICKGEILPDYKVVL